MPLPQFEKQWEFDVNQQYAVGSTAEDTCRSVLRGIKDSLVGVLKGRAAVTSPWVVTQSSDGTTSGTSDLWTGATEAEADAKLLFGAASHSWIVLEQPGISQHFQICIDLSNPDPTKATIVWAPDGFLSDGTTTGRPTATTVVFLLDDATWLGGQTSSSYAYPFYIHAMQSVDGKCTRVVGYQQQTPVLFWLFDQPAGTVGGWSDPAIALATGSTGGNVTYDALHTVSTPNLRGYGNNAALSFWMSTESFGSTPAAIGAQLGANAFDTNYTLTPIGLACLDSGQSGRHGEIVDLWFGSTSANSADTYPNDGSRQLVQFGHLVFPWDGTPEVDGSTPGIGNA